MDTENIIVMIAISAIITFSLRALPFAIFKSEEQMPKKIVYLGKILPSAIMAVLVVYCLKGVGKDFINDGVFQIIAVIIVFVSYKWKHNTFISILCGTAFYMFMIK